MQTASAAIVCSTSATPLPPGGSGVVPGDCTGIGAGTLFATLSAPWNSADGHASGTVVSAVYKETGGTLDFFYQVTNNSTCMLPPCVGITRETNNVFTGVMTAVATRTDGANFSSTTGFGPSDPFVNGTVLPTTVDRTLAGDLVGWNFANQIAPGTTSDVFIITTDATQFGAGSAFLFNGATELVQVAAFDPLLPEPATAALVGLGLLAVVSIRRTFGKRK